MLDSRVFSQVVGFLLVMVFLSKSGLEPQNKNERLIFRLKKTHSGIGDTFRRRQKKLKKKMNYIDAQIHLYTLVFIKPVRVERVL